MKFKKLTFGTILPIVACASTVISCSGVEGRKIDVVLSDVDAWLLHHEISPFIQNNDKPNSSPLDIPIYRLEQQSNIGDIFDNQVEPKMFKVSLKNQKETINDLLSDFSKVNIEINQYLKEQYKKNPNSQYIGFYKTSISFEISISVRKLKDTNGDTDFKFLDKIKPEYDFNTTPDPKNNGVALRVQWALRESDPDMSFKWISSNKTPWNQKERWRGFTANRIGKNINLEQEFAKNPINLATYPYIDYKNKVVKVMVIAFKDGYFKEAGSPPFNHLYINKAKKFRYKVVTIKNMLPFTDSPIPATPQQKDTLNKIINQLGKWVINNNGPGALSTALKLTSNVIPEIQLLLDDVEDFSSEFKKQIKDFRKKKHKSNLSDRDYARLPILNTASITKMIDKVAKNMQDNHFDFTKLDDIWDLLKDDRYKKYDFGWAKGLATNGTAEKEQIILTKILLLLKYISPEWSKLK